MDKDKQIIDNILDRLFTTQHIWTHEDKVEYLRAVFNKIRKKAVEEYIKNNNLKGGDL